MGIEFFSQDEEAPSLEFLPDALEENKNLHDKVFDVFSFKKAKSGKGYMLYTSHFICWFFKKEKVLQQALEALDYYCKTGSGFQFVVKVDKNAKNKFHLGIDSEREAKYIPLENASYRSATTNDMEGTPKKSKETNPFLLNSSIPPLSSLPTEALSNGDTSPPSIPQGEKGRTRQK